MVKKFILSAAVLFGFQAGAVDLTSTWVSFVKQAEVQTEIGTQQLPWVVGETADYKLNIGGFLNGTMKMLVRELTPEGFWIEQNIDLMIQKQKVEILFDASTGQVKEILVDGQKQQMPEAGEQEILESRPDTVTVPAGTFECAYLKIKDKKENSETELWVNPDEIPILGLIKNVGQSQIGPVTMELTAFNKR